MHPADVRREAVRLLSIAYRSPAGQRPVRYQPDLSVLHELLDLAGLVPDAEASDGPWHVRQGARRMLDRRRDNRSVPLVCRDHIALVVQRFADARLLAGFLNWCNAPLPTPSGDRSHPPDDGGPSAVAALRIILGLQGSPLLERR